MFFFSTKLKLNFKLCEWPWHDVWYASLRFNSEGYSKSNAVIMSVKFSIVLSYECSSQNPHRSCGRRNVQTSECNVAHFFPKMWLLKGKIRPGLIKPLEHKKKPVCTRDFVTFQILYVSVNLPLTKLLKAKKKLALLKKAKPSLAIGRSRERSYIQLIRVS